MFVTPSLLPPCIFYCTIHLPLQLLWSAMPLFLSYSTKFCHVVIKSIRKSWWVFCSFPCNICFTGQRSAIWSNSCLFQVLYLCQHHLVALKLFSFFLPAYLVFYCCFARLWCSFVRSRWHHTQVQSTEKCHREICSKRCRWVTDQAMYCTMIVW